MLIVARNRRLRTTAGAAGKPDDSPEYFFHSIGIHPNGTRGYGHRVGPGFVCPEFGGGNFFPPQSNGWGMDYPGADCKFLGEFIV